MGSDLSRQTHQIIDEKKATTDIYRRYVNPDFVQLLETLRCGRNFVKASGTKLFDDKGRQYTDFLSSFGVHNIGHNHPRIIEALRQALEKQEPSMLNIYAPEIVGSLAQELTQLTHSNLCRSVFANSGAEAADIAIRASCQATGRKNLLACDGAYHGLSVGSSSLMGKDYSFRLSNALMEHVNRVPFGEINSLKEALIKYKPAAFFVEPIQAEGGVRIPDDNYLSLACDLCRSYGTLFVVDEIQTGLGRTGRLFATDFYNCLPDIFLIGKALSAGMVPVAAAMMQKSIWQRAFSGAERSLFIGSTFSGGTLAMRTGLEVLSILRENHLSENAYSMGKVLIDGLNILKKDHGIIHDVRGKGLLIGIEFMPPSGLRTKLVPSWAREGLYANVISALLIEKHNMITQPSSLAQNVLRIEPPLTISQEEIKEFIRALDKTISECPTYNNAIQFALKMKFIRAT